MSFEMHHRSEGCESLVTGVRKYLVFVCFLVAIFKETKEEKIGEETSEGGLDLTVHRKEGCKSWPGLHCVTKRRRAAAFYHSIVTSVWSWCPYDVQECSHQVGQCAHRFPTRQGVVGGETRQNTMWAEVVAYMIYLEGPEYPEYVMHIFYLKCSWTPNMGICSVILSQLVLPNKQHKIT